jgi:hypothetical protein
VLKLRDYQEKSQVILARDSSGLDGSDMGTGKTLTGVERVRQIAREIGRAPRVLVVAPTNTQRQWLHLFGEQFPHLATSEHLRIVGTPGADPGAWSTFMLYKKAAGIFIIGWEAMRGMCPKSVQIITQEAADRIAEARADRRSAKKVLGRKRTTEDERLAALRTVEEAERAMVVQDDERGTTDKGVPEGWVVENPGGASRGYGSLYKGGHTLTKQAVLAAMRQGDVPPWSRTGTWDLVIADESHRMARKSSINKITMSILKADAKLAASATPAGNKPEGMWSTLNWLWPKEYPSFWTWAKTFMEIEDSHISQDATVQKIIGEVDPGATWLDIPCKVRHRVSEVRDQLPDVIERIVEVDMTAEQRRIYNEFADRSLAWIDDHPVGERLPLSQRIRLRQAALGTLAVTADDPDIELGFRSDVPQPKLDMIKDILSDLPDTEPVMIYTHSAKWAHMAAEALNAAKIYGEAKAWTGALNQKRRDAVKEAFGVMTPNGPRARFSHKGLRIIIAQLQAIAEGVDGLQRRCACEIWASPTESEATINGQARGRLHRDGQTRPVQRWLLHSLDTIDVGLDESLRARRTQMKQFYRDKVT